MQEGHDNYAAQHYALWQVTAFRLPVVQQEASRWWESLPTLQGLCPQDFLPPASDLWNFQIIWQENTLALARVLQACAETSWAKLGILSGAIRELQQYMALLMTINRDDVMEASLLRPIEEEAGPSSTPEEKTTLLGEGNGLTGAPVPAALQAEIPRFIEPAKQTTTPVTSTVPHSHPSLKREESWEGIDVNSNNSGPWVHAYLKRNCWLPGWWEV